MLAADIVPTIIIKSTAPLWVHHFPFVVRVGICTACSVAAFLVTGFGGTPTVRLLGVALGSVASGWGEVTFLAMSAFYPGKQVLTAWSSGTGIAGVAGSGWFLLLHTVLGVPAPLTLKLGAAWAGAFFLVYAALLPTPAQAHACVPASGKPPPGEREGGSASPLATSDHSPLLEEGQGGTRDGVPSLDLDTGSRQGGGGGYAPVAATPPAPHGDFQQAQQQQSPKDSTLPVVPRDALQSAASTRNMSLPQRLRVIAPLWVYMLPLFLVYAAEYVVQTGVNSALQFHGLSASQWYVIAGFCYQCGVFVSRSSGTVLPLKLLWPLPLLQVLTLGLFLVQGFTYFIPSPIVMGALTVWVGLLGGATCAFLHRSSPLQRATRHSLPPSSHRRCQRLPHDSRTSGPRGPRAVPGRCEHC